MTPEELRGLVAATLGIAPDRVHDELAFGEIPEWDSVAHVELMLAVEERLGTEIGPDEMVELANVALIAEFAAAHGGAGERA